MRKGTSKDTDFLGYRIDAVKAAKDLHYGDDVVKAINEAKSIGEIERIMRSARLRQSGGEKRTERWQYDGTGNGVQFGKR